MSEIVPDEVLDAKGLSCPMPVLKTKKAIVSMQPGQVLKVMTTDPASKADVPALIKRLGHEVISIEQHNGEFSFYIRKL